MGFVATGIDAATLVDRLEARGFPVAQLRTNPISALESMGGELNGFARAVCPVGCLACCADALRPSDLRSKVSLLTPEMLAGFLSVVEELMRREAHVLSTGRLNLFSGSNELDHPNCIELRELLSAFLEHHYGVPLGFASSDVAFHISGSNHFRTNLRAVLERPTLWDNICFSIDEQVPLRHRADYERYMANLASVWEILAPALKAELPHAKPSRTAAPRVILNLLIPAGVGTFEPEYSQLYAGGPERATSHEELLARYVGPFVGSLQVTSTALPDGHVFTTGSGTLSGIVGSRVYISAATYAVTDRGRRFIRPYGAQVMLPRAIRTKVIPVSDKLLRVRAFFTTTHVSEDEVTVAASARPAWFKVLDNISIDTDALPQWYPQQVQASAASHCGHERPVRTTLNRRPLTERAARGIPNAPPPLQRHLAPPDFAAWPLRRR